LGCFEEAVAFPQSSSSSSLSSLLLLIEEGTEDEPNGNHRECSSGTGRFVVPVIQKQRPRVLPHHPANSSTLGTV